MTKKKLRFFPRTDSGNAELFAALCKDTVRFDHKQRRWLIWDAKRGRWAADKQERVRAIMKQAARQRHRIALESKESEERTQQIKWAHGSENGNRIDAALKSAKSEPPISDDGEGWDADPWLLGVENGIVDLCTGELRAGTQQDRLTKFSPVLFDASAKCPRFEKFVRLSK